MSQPAYLRPPVARSVWTIAPPAPHRAPCQIPRRNSLSPAGGTREPRARPGGPDPENSRRGVLGTPETQELGAVETSLDQRSPAKLCKSVTSPLIPWDSRHPQRQREQKHLVCVGRGPGGQAGLLGKSRPQPCPCCTPQELPPIPVPASLNPEGSQTPPRLEILPRPPSPWPFPAAELATFSSWTVPPRMNKGRRPGLPFPAG